MATTSYIPPITNRTRNDVEYAKIHQDDLTYKNIGAWNYTDLNRICNNLKHAAEVMFDKGFLLQPYSMQVKTDWKETDIITYEQLNSMIINNMNNLKSYSREDLNWTTILSITNMDYFLANAIERNIDELVKQEPIPPDDYELIVRNGKGSGKYQSGEIVTIQADPPESGLVFSHWSGDHLENIGSVTSSITTYKMPHQNITIVANYTSITTHTLVIETHSKTTEINLSMGEIYRLEADPAPQGKVFHHWIIEPDIYEGNLYEPAATTTFTMPNEDVHLTAFYINKGKKYLEVKNGTGSGWYEYGTYVAVGSNKPADGTFINWTRDIQYLTDSATTEYNSVKIPDVSQITIEAHWSVPPGPPYVPATNVPLKLINATIDETGLTEGLFTEGDVVSITANPVVEGDVFTGWHRSPSNTGYVWKADMKADVTIGARESTMTASYRTLTYSKLTVTTNSGTTSEIKEAYESFSVEANPPPDGYTFDEWTGDIYSFGPAIFKSEQSHTGTAMGYADRTIRAKYREITEHTLKVYKLDGSFETFMQDEFTNITITAENAPTGQLFIGWQLSGPGKVSSNALTTIFTFGKSDATLKPVYVYIWNVTVENGVMRETTSSPVVSVLQEGKSYRLECRPLAVYEKFDGWTIVGEGTIANLAATVTTFTCGHSDAIITANISEYPDKTLSLYERDPDTGTDKLISSNTYKYGSQVSIEAPVAPNRTTFLTWLGDTDIVNAALASSTSVTMTKDATIVATYYYPESPQYYTLTVYDGNPREGTYAAGSQIGIRANDPAQDWEFYKWYGDTEFLVNPDLTSPVNSVIIPLQSITLYAKFKVIGETPLYRVNVLNGTASGTYEDAKGDIHTESGSYIDVPAGTSIILTADSDLVGWVFDYWSGNFESAGVTDLIATDNPATFTMPESDMNIMMNRRELDKYTVYPTNSTTPGTVYPGTYTITGNLQNTEEKHYVFQNWLCVDADNNDCIEAIRSPMTVETEIVITDKDLWVTAVYKTYYKLTVIEGQDDGDKYYYEGQVVNTVYANEPPAPKLQFDHWDDPMGVVENIYDPTPKVTMKDSVATITAVFTSTDVKGNSILVTGNDLHEGTIYRSRTSLVNGLFAVGAVVFDKDGCIGMITEVDPDKSDDTDDFSVKKLFYGGNS